MKTKLLKKVEFWVDGRCTDRDLTWKEAMEALKEMADFVKENPENAYDIELKFTVSAGEVE